MKNITQLKKAGKAVAGSALLVGATLTGAAGLAAAQDDSGSMDLGDYPAPFLSDDGEVQSTIVVGNEATTQDVVGAINVAGSLGNAAFETTTESVQGAAGGSWSATDGATLDTENDNLYFGQTVDEVRQTLTQEQLDLLQTTEFEDGSGSTQDVEQYLYVGENDVRFSNPSDEDQDPFLNVENPATVEAGDEGETASYLYRLQANFGDGVEFGDGSEDDPKNEDVYGEEVELFGQEFTISQDSFTSSASGQLVLYGSSENVQISNGESSTITVDGEEHTIEVQAVNGEGVVYSVDGESATQDSVDETFNIGDTEVRIDSKIDLADDSGSATFSIGSEKLTLEDEEPVMLGDNEDEVEGTNVALSGTNTEGDIEDSEGVSLSSIEVAVGADDSDNNYVRADEAFEDPVFDLAFQFGGLNPDAAEDDVSEVSFTTDDEVASVDFEDGDDSATVEFFETGQDTLQNDGENVHVMEGTPVEDGEFFVSDAGDFDHMWEVTDISVDAQNPDSDDDTDDEATVELEDVVSGNEVEIDLSEDSNADGDQAEDDGVEYSGSEVIDGQTYDFDVDTGADSDAPETVSTTWTDDDTTSVFTALDTASGASVAFTEEVTLAESTPSTADDASDGVDYTLEVPSTESTGTQEVTINIFDSTEESPVGSADDGDINYDVNGGSFEDGGTYSPDGSGLTYVADNSSGLTFSVQEASGPSAIVLQPEDNSDVEDAYVVSPSGSNGEDADISDNSDGSVISYTAEDYATETLDSDDNMEVSYNDYGTYTEQDTDDEGAFTLNIPSAQATAGAAFTAADGSLDASGAASGSVETQSPTGWPDSAALDSDSNIDQTKTSENTILVGGPAVNALTDELAQDDKTQTRDEYEEGDQLVQLVEDSFSEGVHSLVVSGYSGEDTRAAAGYISNYGDHSEELSGQSQVNLQTMQTTE